MATMKTVRRDLGPAVCRMCINKYYHAHLRREDCIYDPYPHICTCCGEMKHIVDDLRPSGKLKLLPKSGE